MSEFSQEEIDAAIREISSYIRQINEEDQKIEKYIKFISTLDQLKGEWANVGPKLLESQSCFIDKGGLNIRGQDPTKGKITACNNLGIDTKIVTLINSAKNKKKEHISKYIEIYRKAESIKNRYGSKVPSLPSFKHAMEY